MNTAQELARLPAFRGFNLPDLQAFARHAPLVEFNKETIVMAQGQVAEGSFLIISGRVRAEVQSGSKRMVLGRLGAGEVFGELGLYACGVKRSATVIADEQVIALLILPALLGEPSVQPVLAELERRCLASLADRIRRSSATARHFTDEEEDDDPSSTFISSVMNSLRRLVGG